MLNISRLRQGLSRAPFWSLALALAVAALAGGWVAYRAFTRFELSKVLKRGQEAFGEAKYGEAALAGRRALQLDPDSLPARLLLADTAEKAGDPSAIQWRDEIARGSGESAESLLAYAGTALKFGRFPTAQAILSRIAESERARPEFHALSGEVALASEDLKTAERSFAEAARTSPGNQAYRFRLAGIRAMASDFFIREEGRRELQNFSQDPNWAQPASRILITSLRETKEFRQALRFATALVENKEAPFRDHLEYLSLLQVSGSNEMGTALATLEARSATNPIEARALISWMDSAGMSNEALAWAKSVFPEDGNPPEIQPALAACHFSLEDWASVAKLCKSQSWAQVDYLRHAYLSRVYREIEGDQAASSEWRFALSAAGASAEALQNLASIAAAWNWESEEEEVLLLIVDKQPHLRSAIERLSQRYLARKDTDGLRKLVDRRLHGDPNNDDLLNDKAYLSLLQGKDEEQALRISRELHQRHPENTVYASTFALALQISGQVEEARQVLEKFPEAALRAPSVAATYGCLLVATKAPTAGLDYLRAAKSAQLLPEEAALVEEAIRNAEADRANLFRVR